MIFLGSSKVYCDIATGVLWDNYGIASFDLGGAEAPAWVSYYQLKEALRTQKPKIVCYEVSISAMYPTLSQSDEWASDNSYGMKWNSNRIEQIRANSEEDEFYVRLNPFNIMHGRYNDLKKNDFINIRDTANYKGFDPREKTVKSNKEDISLITDITPCSEKAEEYTRKIIDLCRSEGIKIVLFTSPYEVPHADQEIINYMWTIADSEGVEHIDFNGRYDEMKLDFEEDISTGHHLNYNGNYKFSNYFGSILRNEYGIPDRRGDKAYISWEWDAAAQRAERVDLMINESEDAGEVVSLAQDGYIVFAVGNGNGCIMENGQITKDAQAPVRLTYSSGDDTFLLVEEGEGNVEHYVSLFVNDVEYKEEYGNTLFIYDAVRHEYVRSIQY